MSTRVAAGYAPVLYGAYELKQGYRGAMIAALTLAVLGHLMIVGSILLYQSHTPERTIPGPSRTPMESDGRVIIVPLPPLPSITHVGTNLARAAVAPPVLGRITPTKDVDVVEDPDFPTTTDLARISQPVVIGPGGIWGQGSGTGDVSNYQGPATMVPEPPSELEIETVLPKLVYSEKPVYPDLALLTEISGTVVIRALVDETGKVREARIYQSSGARVGFDEAAREAALKYRYRPAIQNGRPVATWVVYRVDFKIKR